MDHLHAPFAFAEISGKMVWMRVGEPCIGGNYFGNNKTDVVSEVMFVFH